MDDDDGITTYRREIPGSPLVGFRGETTITAPIGKVAAVLDDVKRKTEWMYHLEESKMVKKISDLERIEYNHTFVPVFTDRDFVYHAKVTPNPQKKQLVLVVNSVVDPAMPEHEKYVRGELKDTVYVLTALENNTKTHIDVVVNADPKGLIPKGLVNLFQKKWPRNTLEGIRKQAAKEDVIALQSIHSALGL
jgi:hypothetical protein